MKDENNSLIMKRFVCVKEKVYAIEVLNEDNSAVSSCKKAAGTNRNVIPSFTLNDHYNCLSKNEVKISENVRIQNKKHILRTVKLSRVSLRASNNKRIVKPDSLYDTYAIGHYKTK